MSPTRNSFQSRRFKNKRKKYDLITLRQKNDYTKFGESHPSDAIDTVKNYSKVEDASENKDEDNSSSSESEEDVPVLKQLMDAIGAKEEEPESEQEENDESSSEEKDSDDENVDHSTADENDVEDTFVSATQPKRKDYYETLDTDCNIENLSRKRRRLNDVSEFFDSEAAEENELDLGSETVEKGVDESGEESSSFIDDEAVEKDDSDDYDTESEGDEFLESDNHSDSESSDDNFQKTSQCKEKTVGTARDKILSKSRNKQRMSNKSARKETEKTEGIDELKGKYSDPFSKHFEIDIEEDDLISESFKWEKKEIKVKHKLCDQLASVNKHFTDKSSKSYDGLSAFQHKLFCILNSYQDVLYPKQDFSNMEDIRLVYCLHILNHVLKTRSRIVAHNAKLQSKDQNALDDIEYRDQGLTRPKILILLPYRDKALKVFKMLSSLLSASQEIKVSSRKRFETEFSELEKKDLAGKKYKSDDFIKMFEGNVDDNFRVGLSISKKSLRLYSPFYESDIILASPLGIRTVIGNEGDARRDFDFLSSIEILIMDQTDVFLMQNWDHVAHIFKHLHLQPKEAHGTDFSRVRMWAIDGLSKHFRQTVILSSVVTPEIMTVFNKQCHNYTGKILIQRDVKVGTIGSCLSDAAQIFHQVICDKPDGISQRNAKLDYLKKKIIPHHTSRGMNQTVIYCNYFSFVLLRNYFREADVDFLFINEYDSEKDISRTRIKFRKKSPHFLLYTERLHFHHRFRLRGIHHIVWFDVPQYPQFYPEMVNLMEVAQQTCTSTCLFTKYDGQKVMEIVGQKRAAHIVNSEKSVHMITVS